ncbi:MAG TPA: GNAT family N-acetyltransferase [Roseiarcus sp.]
MPFATALRPEPIVPRAPRRAASPRSAFARVEIFDSFAAAREPWTQIERSAAASPYQSFDFARIWAETVGAERRLTPLIIVARDEDGSPTALLPLARLPGGPLRLAVLLGGKDANFGMGLFRPDLDWSHEAVKALLDAGARAAAPRLDAFLFANQPWEWQGAPNPMAGIRGQPSPSFAYKSALPAEFSAWRDAHASKDAQKKQRKKIKRLETLGPLVHRRAAEAAEADRILRAFEAQKSARMRSLGVADDYGTTAARECLAQLARCGLDEGAPRLELHALTVGERIVATFGALSAGDRLSGLFLSFDADPEIARSSPGELIVHAAVEDAIARGFRTLDLGVGEARYKSEACEAREELFDSAHAVTPLGAAAAFAYLAKQRIKRRVKQSPRLLALSRRLCGALGI